MNAPAITSIGPPHELHAKRVVGEMMRWLAHDFYVQAKAAYRTLVFSNMGNPIAQRRHVDRLVKRMGRDCRKSCARGRVSIRF